MKTEGANYTLHHLIAALKEKAKDDICDIGRLLKVVHGLFRLRDVFRIKPLGK
jgi:hypothetical protein